MKTTQITLHGRVFNMPSNYRVLQTVTDRICDPLKVLAETGRSGGSMVNLPLTQAQCVLLLAIGIKATGLADTEPEESLCQSVYEMGASEYTPLAIVFLAALCGGDDKAVPGGPKARAAARRR